MATKTQNLTLLQRLHGKIIIHKNRLFRVAVEVKTYKREVVDVKPTFLQSLFGGVTVTKWEDVEDVECVFLIDLKGSKTQKCMSTNVFIEKVVLEPNEKIMTVFHVTRKLRDFFNLKSDFYMIYDLTPKEQYKKVDNV